MAFGSVLAVALATGCATTGAGGAAGGGRPATTLSQSRDDYLAGLKALQEADYTTAVEVLQRVARGPSYIVYVPLARLRLADALFFQEKYDEAVEGYRTFIETAAGDPNLHYAYYRLAESRVKAIAGDFFLVPPSDRRDQKRVRAALASLRDFAWRFPDSPYVAEAHQMMDRMTGIVASFELEVARFYSSRGKPQGAANRIGRLMDDVPGASRLEEARAALVEALAEARDDRLAGACAAYLDDFPGGKSRGRVARICARTTPPG